MSECKTVGAGDIGKAVQALRDLGAAVAARNPIGIWAAMQALFAEIASAAHGDVPTPAPVVFSAAQDEGCEAVAQKCCDLADEAQAGGKWAGLFLQLIPALLKLLPLFV